MRGIARLVQVEEDRSAVALDASSAWWSMGHTVSLFGATAAFQVELVKPTRKVVFRQVPRKSGH